MIVVRQGPKDKEGKEMIPPEVKVRLVRQVRRYELITPLFGGGVEPGEADELTVIRGPEIRGHLRFWWRATRGGSSNGDLNEMRKREEEIWGAASKPSRVEVRVEVEDRGKEEKPFESSQGENGKLRVRPKENVAPSYTAFPLRPQDKEIKSASSTDDLEKLLKPLRDGVHFRLELVYPQELKEDVEAALWAWETFGGVGARTRRGFEALNLLEVDGEPVPLPKCSEVEDKIRKELGKYVVKGKWPEGVPHLSRALRMKVIAKNFSEPKEAWDHLIGKLKEFRQYRHRRKSEKTPGRSFWPEPDAIRKLTGRRSHKHKDPVSSVRKFPRAALGLPIVFHFKDEKAGDPYDTTLVGENLQRLASPLILRPLACADGAVGLALILEGTSIEEFLKKDKLFLKKKDDPATKWEVDALLTPTEAKEIKPLGDKPDVLQAFLDRL
ncbi:type III-B CRISPR module RAMP protein Cmr1 [Desulfothermobacter acidiphilus]|uniref:type III-B CRISPR module RAMP protein Cmr1 n=1 Tax=Desulfothermobacter acidiphilus TaxID=1938353 RepID=UPI003F8ACBEC